MLLITNGITVTWGSENRILEGHALAIQGDRIAEMGPQPELERRYAEAERLDARGQLVMPGNICSHTHFYGAFARGLAMPGEPPRDFPEILSRLWWRLDRSLDRQAIEDSALVCLVDAVRHGTTTLIDHHASPNAIEGSLDVIARAVERAGLRACLAYEVSDRDGPHKARAAIAENVRFLRREKPGTLAGSFGLHASLTLSDATLESAREALPAGAGFHIHVAEHEADQEDSVAKHGRRVVERLGALGILGERTIAAHCVHVDEAEMDLLAQTGTWVTHQPRSNMNNGVGPAPVEGLLERGVRVGLGNDGFSNAMWEEWKAAYLYHKAAHRDPRRMGGETVVRMAVGNNARLARIFWPEAPLGELAAGAYADLIFVDYHPTTPLTPGNLPWHVLFGFQPSMVTLTMCAGRVLMKDRRLLTLDEEAITRRSREAARATWQRFTEAGP